MSYDLIPKNKNVKAISVGAFSWPIILQETGMGYIIGYGEGRAPATNVYQPRKEASPTSNDGYKISSAEAKMMAAVIKGFLSVQRFINKEWQEIPEPERQKQKDTMTCGKHLYKGEWSEDRLKQIETIGEFFKKSGGFAIH